jgi:hypothetical protein
MTFKSGDRVKIDRRGHDFHNRMADVVALENIEGLGDLVVIEVEGFKVALPPSNVRLIVKESVDG